MTQTARHSRSWNVFGKQGLEMRRGERTGPTWMAENEDEDIKERRGLSSTAGSVYLGQTGNEDKCWGQNCIPVVSQKWENIHGRETARRSDREAEVQGQRDGGRGAGREIYRERESKEVLRAVGNVR